MAPHSSTLAWKIPWTEEPRGLQSVGHRVRHNWVQACICKLDNGGGFIAQSCLTLAALWTAAHQPPLSMGFSRQEYWSGLPFPSPGDLPDPGIKPRSPALQADSLPTELWGKPTNEKLPHSTENSAQYCVMAYMGRASKNRQTNKQKKSGLKKSGYT